MTSNRDLICKPGFPLSDFASRRLKFRQRHLEKQFEPQIAASDQ